MSSVTIQERRGQQARDLASLIRKTGKLVLPEANPDFPNRDGRFDHVYGKLGERLYGGLITAAAQLEDPKLYRLVRKLNVLNGCYVMTRILSYGPQAYADHVDLTASSPETALEDLGQVMKRDKAVVKIFADTDIRSNQTYEANFGLLQHAPTYPDVLPFVVGPDADGNPSFQASPVVLMRTWRDVADNWRGPEPYPEAAKPIYCPAVGMVLNHLWGTAVNACMSEPNLFPADLAMLRGATSGSVAA